MSREGAEEFRVTLDGVHLAFGDRRVFDEMSIGFQRGKITVVLGGSGGGKSTLLRLIGGLQRPDRGSVRVAGEDLAQLSNRDLFRARDRIGMLFQGGALLDSMTLFENVALPLQEHTDLSEEDIAAEVSRRLVAVGLENTEELFPRQLSGGMVRRAALARAVVTDPEIVLCDEPFSGLDPINVRRIEDLMVDLNRRIGITLILTSHHVQSAFRMADRFAFLVDGKAFSMTPEDFKNSDHPSVVEFLEAESDEFVHASAAAGDGSSG
jgi:phospholipid/cholesterol/gamma-HCH transport system ATP-binding protein